MSREEEFLRSLELGLLKSASLPEPELLRAPVVPGPAPALFLLPPSPFSPLAGLLPEMRMLLVGPLARELLRDKPCAGHVQKLGPGSRPRDRKYSSNQAHGTPAKPFENPVQMTQMLEVVTSS